MQSQSFVSTREHCQSAIEQNLARFLAQSTKLGIGWNSEMARYQFSTGGKRLRAMIPCWVYSACGEDPQRAVSMGSAVEMIHNATLVHDDLQDGDTVRRGKATVWVNFSSAQAINCGDAMFQFGIQLLLETSVEPRLLCSMSRRLLHAVTEVIEGQAQEFLLKDEAVPTVEHYLRVAEGKTAALFAAAFALPLESLGKPGELCNQVDQASRELGILFQIQDDVLDVYGDKAREKRATDIAEGKISYLIVQLLEDATPADRERTLAILHKPRDETTDGEIAQVLELFEKYGTRQAALRRIASMRERIRKLAWREQEPAIHELLLGIGELFLEPIRHLELQCTA